MSYANGRVPNSALTKVQGDMYLEKKAANAWFAMKDAAKEELGRTISIASPGGANRPFWMQDEMYRASRGNVALAKKWGLNPNSSVPLAAAGNSSHGFGTRVDIVGTPIDSAFIRLAKRFGFTLEFGRRDPNHFIHDGRVISVLDADERKLKAGGALVWSTPLTDGVKLDKKLAGGKVVKIEAYAVGRAPKNQTIKTWYRVGKGQWIWAGDCNSTSTKSIRKVDAEIKK